MELVDISKVAQFVVIYCSSLGYKITPLKLQKILFYIQALHIVKFDKHTLFEDQPEAWVNGPVYRKVYNLFKESFYKNSPFKVKEGIDLEESKERIKQELGLPEDNLNFISSVVKGFGALSEEKLVLLTHGEKPWQEARLGLGPLDRSEQKISFETMNDFYSEIVNRTKK